MSKKKVRFSPYSNKICHKAVRFVFDTVDFDSSYAKNIVRDSYFLNLGIMREYARDNHMDEISYILGIRDVLLKSEKAHEL